MSQDVFNTAQMVCNQEQEISFVFLLILNCIFTPSPTASHFRLFLCMNFQSWKVWQLRNGLKDVQWKLLAFVAVVFTVGISVDSFVCPTFLVSVVEFAVYFLFTWMCEKGFNYTTLYLFLLLVLFINNVIIKCCSEYSLRYDGMLSLLLWFYPARQVCNRWPVI